MAPNVKLHFFRAQEINGSVLHEITDEDDYFKKLTLKLERDGLGGAELILARKVGFAGFGSGTFNPEVFVRLIISAYSETDYYPWGFFLDKRQQTVVHVDEDGGEEFHFGGPGPKQYLDRSGLGIEQLTGTGWNLDLENGVWRWNETATVGRILNRIYQEDQARDDPALPDLTLGFDASDDSNSNPWTDDDLGGPDQFELPIGHSLLKALWDIDDVVELTSWIELGTVAAPIFELNVAEGLGADKTGSAVGAGVCLLKEGLNIANKALTTEGHSLRKASHVIVEGKDGNWAEAVRPGFVSGNFVRYAKISYTRTNTPFWLEKAGIRWLKRQDYGEKELTVEILPGTSDATGYYFPAPNRNLWLSNLISVDTSADGMTHTPLDIQPSEDQLVTGLLLETHEASDDSSATAKARSWDVTVVMNRERPGNVQKTPDQKSAAAGSGLNHRHPPTERVEYLSTYHRFPLWCHRGDIGSVDSYPENTLEAHRQAILKGADGTELDVWYSSDGTGWLSHDSTVDRVTDGTGTIASKTDVQLAALNVDGGYGYDAGRHGTSLSLATLEDTITALVPYDPIIKVQLVDSSVANALKLGSSLLLWEVWERCVIEVSTIAEVEAIKSLNPNMTVMVHQSVGSAIGHPDIEWLSVRNTTIVDLAYCTSKAPQRIGAYTDINDFGTDESTVFQQMFDRGAASFQTNNLDAALGMRQSLIYGGTGPFSGHWEPVTFNNAGTPEIVYFNGDIVMYQVAG